jgi:hypothetical protein
MADPDLWKSLFRLRLELEQKLAVLTGCDYRLDLGVFSLVSLDLTGLYVFSFLGLNDF